MSFLGFITNVAKAAGKKGIPLVDDVAKAITSGSDDAAKEALSVISKGTKPTIKQTFRNPITSFRSNPFRTGIKWGLAGAVPGAFVANKLGLLDFMNDDVSYDPSKLVYPKPLSDEEIETEISKSTTSRNKILEDMKTAPLPDVPGSEVFDITTGMVNSMGGATLAEMQRLAAEQLLRGGRIQAGGTAGAADINAVYADAASQLEDSAIQGGEYGNMVPVSGEAYAAPGQALETGASLADYLGQSQLITAQDQGFLSELSNILGPAYANQFALQQQAARAQAEVNKQRIQAQIQMQRDQAYQDAVIQSKLLEDEQRQSIREKSEAVAEQFIPQAVIEGYASEWDIASDDYKKSLLSMTSGRDGVTPIKSKEDYINYRLRTDFGV
jgi:hypothetical protein